MDSKVLHDIKKTPFNERETFNNAILLLSMVKSEFYYIVGFSRPDNIIEIGFDFENKLYGKCSEIITMDFSSVSDSIKVSCSLVNIEFGKKMEIPFENKEFFKINNGYIQYEICFEKDSIIPVSIEKLNSMILSVKNDIGKFLNDSFSCVLRKKDK